METKVICVDGGTFDQWQSIGLVEGLVDNLDIARFLIHLYDVNKERGALTTLCPNCHTAVRPLCDTCRSSQPPANVSQPAICLTHTGNDQSQSGTSLSCFGTSQSQSGINMSHENGQSQLVSSQSYPKTGQLQPLTNISHPGNNHSQSETNQTQPENSQSEPGTSQPYSASLQAPPSIMQSETGINQSELKTSQRYSASIQSHPSIMHSQTGISQSEPGTKRPYSASFQSHQSVMQLETGISQSEPLLADSISPEERSSVNFSQHSQLDEGDSCALLVKEKDDDDDDTRDAPYVEPDSLPSEPDLPTFKQEPLLFPDDSPSPYQGEKREWGPTESKALSWFLDRYELHSPTGWDDCALLLNAALNTSTTGEDCRKLALKRNLVILKTTRRTRSSGLISLDTDPKGPKQTSSSGATESERPRKTRSSGMTIEKEPEGPTTTSSSKSISLNSEPDRSGKKRSSDNSTGDMEPEAHGRTRSSGTSVCSTEPQGPRKNRSGGRRSKEMELQGPSRTRSSSQKAVKVETSVRTSRRPGLRSSSQPTLMQVAPDHDDPDDKTFTQPTSLSDDEEEKKEDITMTIDKRDVAMAMEKKENVALTLCDTQPMKREVEDGISPTSESAVDFQQMAPASSMEETEMLSQNHVDASGTLDLSKTFAGNKLSWHYLGVADVDLPDVNQKRKSFRHSPNDRYQCKECSSSFTHRGILVKHIRLAHLKWRPYRCDFCSAAYATKTKLQRHVNVAHTKVRPFCCETCGASFVDHYTLLCHKDTHNENRQYRFFCELCGKGYYGMRELKRHMETHSSRPTKSLLCWVCGKAVRTTQYLRIHLRTHSPEKAFTCTDCGHVFTSKCALAKHKTSLACRKRLDRNKSLSEGCEEDIRKKRAVSLVRKRRERKLGNFQCDICHKFFSAKKSIYKHKRSVHGIEAKREIDNRIVLTDPAEIARYLTPKKRDISLLKFACDICSKQYSSQESMRKHKNIVHFGRRDYKCDLCDKTFTRHTSVIEHKHNVHNPAGKLGRQTAQCDICQKMFAAKNSLRKHLKTVHFGLLPYSCVVCGKKFASRYHLREHHKTSGHVTQEEESGAEPSSKDMDHTVSSSAPPSQITDTCSSIVTMSGLVTSCLSTLHPINPWASLAPSSGVVTAVERVASVSLQQQELSADGSTAVRALPPVNLWNMG